MEESYTFGNWGRTSEEILGSKFPLHRACRDGDTQALSLLLREAQHGIYEEDSFYGWTPAHWAAYFGKLRCLMSMLEAGFHADASTVRLNQTASHLAAFASNTHCLKWLLHCGMKLDRQDYLGETAIHKAARTGSIECINLLLSHGALVSVSNNNGHSPAQVAKMCGYPDCSTILEQAASMQETRAPGLPVQPNGRHNITIPSPHDITSSMHAPRLAGPDPAGGDQPGLAPPVNEDCDMMETDSAASHGAMGPPVLSNGIGTKDITLDCDVSANRVPIGGRKRTREFHEESSFKRMRHDDAVSSNYGNSHGLMFSTLSRRGVQEEEKEEEMGAGSGGVIQPLNGESDISMSIDSAPEPYMTSIDYDVGYDYNGIPEQLEEELRKHKESTTHFQRKLNGCGYTPKNYVVDPSKLAGHYI